MITGALTNRNMVWKTLIIDTAIKAIVEKEGKLTEGLHHHALRFGSVKF